jgi:glycosyltransferase involved in cell wall biosynthesis
LEPLVSVIIPTRNRAHTLKRAIDSILADPYPAKEIVVADGASTDDTVALLKSYGDKVSWVSEPDNGEYDARNKCLKRCTGEYIRYMSDDDILVAGSLGVASDVLTKNKDIDVLFGQTTLYFESPDGSTVVSDGRLRMIESITLKNFLTGEHPFCASEAATFRKSVVERIGYFDTSFRGGDFEYWARACHRGMHFELANSEFAQYHRSARSGVERFRVKLSCELFRLIAKYGTTGDLFSLIFRFFPRVLAIQMVCSWLPSNNSLAFRKWWWRRRAKQTKESIS